MFSDIHIGHLRGKSRPADEFLELYDRSADPVCDDRFLSDHPNDQGERTNRKLKVQPFYHRGRNGKMSRY